MVTSSHRRVHIFLCLVSRRDNPLTARSPNDPRPRSISQESGSINENCEVDLAERGKTSPASFRNLGYQGSFLSSSGRSSADVKEIDSPRSENGRENLSRATSEQSVSSLCSDEVSDKHLETLMECSNEGSQAGSYRESFVGDMIKENGENEDDSTENDSNERGIDIVSPLPRSTESIKSLHLDFKQRLIVKKHMQSHRPSLPAIFPVSSPEKEAARLNTFAEMHKQTMHQKGNKKDKGKDKETKVARSPSTSSSNESQNEDRRSTFYDTEEANDEKTPMSMRKAVMAVLNSKSSKSKENQPDSPKRKIFNFSRNKGHKSSGMHRSKSDMLVPLTGTGEDVDRHRRMSSLNRRSFLEDDTQSLCSIASLDDLTIRESTSDNSLKEKASPNLKKKGRTATLRLQKGTKFSDRKKRDDTQMFHRDEGRVSMRAFLPNRAPLKILNIMKHWVSKHNQVSFLMLDFIGFSENDSEIRLLYLKTYKY